MNVECNAEKLQPRSGRPWSRLKRYRLLIWFAEFVLKANLDLLTVRIRKPTLIFEGPCLAAGLGEPSLHLSVSATLR